jgi:hypothetical protein
VGAAELLRISFDREKECKVQGRTRMAIDRHHWEEKRRAKRRRAKKMRDRAEE